MRQFSAIKLADELILPLVIIVMTRYLSVFLAALLAPLNFSIGVSSSFHTLLFLSFSDKNQAVLANFISWMAVATVLAMYFGFVLFRGLHTASEQLHPKYAQDLHKRNLDFLVIDQNETRHQTIGWLAIVVLVSCLMLYDFLSVGLPAFSLGYFLGLAALLIGISYPVFYRGKN
ncbi:MAG: hypothetical protein A2172_00990 [Candidatus Woykebacteria bacterium RBG_13_40_15]|uniref:Uncharacterized protein n=1 Tax=Candidatus Woykebacteria bacterium RBG_13_40_15 TaxID=1802593 RepID=A0A1G1W8V0_9BACT|nr:MAG: hypothetical protein A2172_00990 [Candidatus Woykebacteria bacterium RBG_13_40_15]